MVGYIKIERKLANIEYLLLMALLVYMPFHYFICELVLRGTRVDNLFRDVFLLFLLALSFIYHRGSIKKRGWLIVINAVIMFIFALVSWVEKKYQGTWNVFRTYILPTCVYFVSSKVILSKKQVIDLHKFLVIVFAAIGVYGLFQAFVLGDQFLIRMGLPSNGGHLQGASYYIGGFWGFQRSIGTFASPNICGAVMAVGICILMFFDIGIYGVKRVILLGMLGVGLIATFSRSAIVGVVLAVSFFYLIGFIGKNRGNAVLWMKIAIGVIALTIGFLIVDSTILHGRVTEMLVSSFAGVINKTDASAAKHWEDIVEPFKYVLENPLGVWFGHNGPMVLSLSEEANAVESSIYLMFYEIGIVFGLMYFLPCLGVIGSTLYHKNYEYYVPAAVCIAVLFTYLLLPNVQTYELNFFLFAMIGLYDNDSIRGIYQHQG